MPGPDILTPITVSELDRSFESTVPRKPDSPKETKLAKAVYTETNFPDKSVTPEQTVVRKDFFLTAHLAAEEKIRRPLLLSKLAGKSLPYGLKLPENIQATAQKDWQEAKGLLSECAVQMEEIVRERGEIPKQIQEAYKAVRELTAEYDEIKIEKMNFDTLPKDPLYSDGIVTISEKNSHTGETKESRYNFRPPFKSNEPLQYPPDRSIIIGREVRAQDIPTKSAGGPRLLDLTEEEYRPFEYLGTSTEIKRGLSPLTNNGTPLDKIVKEKLNHKTSEFSLSTTEYTIDASNIKGTRNPDAKVGLPGIPDEPTGVISEKADVTGPDKTYILILPTGDQRIEYTLSGRKAQIKLLGAYHNETTNPVITIDLPQDEKIDPEFFREKIMRAYAAYNYYGLSHEVVTDLLGKKGDLPEAAAV